MKEYWKSCVSVPRNIILRPDIERCIFSSGENSLRQKRICLEKKEVNIEEEYKKYAEQQRIRKALKDSFANTAYESLIEQIMRIIESPKPLKLLYLDSVKQFGKRDGLIRSSKLYRYPCAVCGTGIYDFHKGIFQLM